MLFGSSTQKTFVDDMEMKSILLTIIIFLSTDFVEGLHNPKAVEKLQLSYCNLLFKYLKSRSGGDRMQATTDMGKAMMMGAYARELCEIENKRLMI